MKRIALIRNSFSHDFGGAELFPINLANILSEEDYTPVIYSSNKKLLNAAHADTIENHHSPWWSMQNYSGWRIIFLPAYFIWITVVTCWYLLFFVKHRIDIVHPQSKDDFIAATIAAIILRKKVIWTDHADLKSIYMNNHIWYKNPVGKAVFKISKYAKNVVIESNSEKKLIEQSLGKTLPKNYIVIYLGVVDTYKNNKVRKINKNVTFICTSRLVYAKGIDELIDAFMNLNRNDASLIICGDGPDAAHFKNKAKGFHNILFKGHVDNVYDYLSVSDVLVHPTYSEGFGLSLVEAQMNKLPIIASNVGSIPEIVDSGISGILVEPKNVDDLMKAMNMLLDDSEMRTRMGAAGRRSYLEKFQFDAITKKQYIPLYEE